MRRLAILLCLCHIALPASASQVTAGPMLGHVTSRTAAVWLQADHEAQAQIEFWPASRPNERRLSSETSLDSGNDFSKRLTLTGLEPGTRYRYKVFLDGEPQPPALAHTFETLPLWQWRQDPPDFTVYLGSCAYLNDPAFDRPGKAYGGEYEIFQSIARQAEDNPKPHLMLWLGDNVYFREADYESPWGMNARYRQARSLPELQPLLQAAPHYAIWDDHDYGPNNANRSFVFKDASLELFRRYWANPSYGQSGLPGVFTTFSFLDADFFLLDDRYYRAADNTAVPKDEIDLLQEAKDWAIRYNPITRLLGKRYLSDAPGWTGEDKVMLGHAQLDWLKQALIQSAATFKIIASGSQMLNDANTFEGWQHFAEEREPFLAWLREQNIPGVIFLSGDRHHTELIKREMKDFYPLYELTCSPLTAKARSAGTEKEKNSAQRVDGTLVEQRNYCSLETAGPPKARRLVLRSFDVNGKQLWERTIQAAEMRAPAKTDASAD